MCFANDLRPCYEEARMAMMKYTTLNALESFQDFFSLLDALKNFLGILLLYCVVQHGEMKLVFLKGNAG